MINRKLWTTFASLRLKLKSWHFPTDTGRSSWRFIQGCEFNSPETRFAIRRKRRGAHSYTDWVVRSGSSFGTFSSNVTLVSPSLPSVPSLCSFIFFSFFVSFRFPRFPNRAPTRGISNRLCSIGLFNQISLTTIYRLSVLRRSLHAFILRCASACRFYDRHISAFSSTSHGWRVTRSNRSENKTENENGCDFTLM